MTVDPAERFQRVIRGPWNEREPVEGLHEMREQLRKMQDRLAEIVSRTYRGIDETRAVEIEVDGHGLIHSLTVTPRGIRQHDHESLVRAILDARSVAAASLAVGMAEEFSEKLGVTLPGPDETDQRLPPWPISARQGDPAVSDPSFAELPGDIRRFLTETTLRYEEFSTRSFTGESDNGGIVATVDSTGRLTCVSIRVLTKRRKDRVALSALLLEAIQAAQGVALKARGDLMSGARLFGVSIEQFLNDPHDAARRLAERGPEDI